MAAYTYTAIDKNGRQQKGNVHADNAALARAQLRKQNLHPTELKEAKQSNKNKKSFSFKQKVSTKELSLFTRQLATLLEAEIPLESALESLSKQFKHAYLKQVIFSVRAKILEGHSLAQALQTHPNVFSKLYTATVTAGEQTGKLAVVLERLADHTEAQQRMKQKVMQALIYPGVMTLVSIAIVTFLLIYVVPNIIQIFSDNQQSLPTVTKILISLSVHLQRDGIFILLGLIAALFTFKFSLKQENFREKYHRFLLRIPLLSHMIKTINTARYARTFGILTASGIPVIEAMHIASQLISNSVMAQKIKATAKHVREGSPIHYALQETNFFTPITVQLIASGENSGRLAEMLTRSADQQDTEVESLIDTLLRLFEPFIIIVMACVVLFIVLAIMIPIFDMNQMVG